MKVRGDNAPLNTFSTEEQPKNPGYSLIRFYENSTPYSSEERGIAVSGYEYDEYHLEVEDRDDLKAYIQNHFDELLAKAKLAEADFCTPQEKRKWAYENELSIIIVARQSQSMLRISSSWNIPPREQSKSVRSFSS